MMGIDAYKCKYENMWMWMYVLIWMYVYEVGTDHANDGDVCVAVPAYGVHARPCVDVAALPLQQSRNNNLFVFNKKILQWTNCTDKLL